MELLLSLKKKSNQHYDQPYKLILPCNYAHQIPVADVLQGRQ